MGILKRFSSGFRAHWIMGKCLNFCTVLCLLFLLSSRGLSQFRVVEQSLVQEGLVVPYTIAEGPNGIRVLHLATGAFADEIAVTWFHDFGWELTQHLVPGGAETVHHLMQTNAEGNDFRYDLKLHGVSCSSSLGPEEWWFQYHGRERDLENILTTHRQQLSELAAIWDSGVSDWAVRCAERLESGEERRHRRLLYSPSEPNYAKRYSGNSLQDSDIPLLIRNMLAPNRITVVVSGGSWDNLRDLLPELLPIPAGSVNWDVNVLPFKARSSDYVVSGVDERLSYSWRTDGRDLESSRYLKALAWILNEPGSYVDQKFGRYVKSKPRSWYASTRHGGIFGLSFEGLSGSSKGLETSFQLRRANISDALAGEDLRKYVASYRWDMLSAYEDLERLSLLYVRDLVRFRNVSQHIKEWKMVENLDLFSLKKSARDLFSSGALIYGGVAKKAEDAYSLSLWKNLNSLSNGVKAWQSNGQRPSALDIKVVEEALSSVKTSKYDLHWEVTESDRYQTCHFELKFPLPEFSEVFYPERRYEEVVSAMFTEVLEGDKEWMDWVAVTNARWGWKVEDKVIFYVQLNPSHAQNGLQKTFEVFTKSLRKGFEGLESWESKAVQDMELWARRAIQPQNTELYIGSALPQRFFTAGWKTWKKWKPTVVGVLPSVSLACVGDLDWSFVHLEGGRSTLENYTLASLVLRFPGAEFMHSGRIRVPASFSLGLSERVSEWQSALDSWSPALYGDVQRLAANHDSQFSSTIFQWQSANPDGNALIRVALGKENWNTPIYRDSTPMSDGVPVVEGRNFEEAFRYAKDRLKPKGHKQFIWKGERYSIIEE